MSPANVDESRADVEAVAARTGKNEAGGDACSSTRQRHHEHESAAHLLRVDEPMNRRPDDPDCEQGERDPVHLRGEDLEPRIPERPAPDRRSGRHRRSEEREAECRRIGEHVPGVREQGERVTEQPGDDLACHHDEDQHERDRQRAAVGLEPVIVVVVRERRLAAPAGHSATCTLLIPRR
jgi:hypothetical protein